MTNAYGISDSESDRLVIHLCVRECASILKDRPGGEKAHGMGRNMGEMAGDGHEKWQNSYYHHKD